MTDFVASGWREHFAANALDSFDALWALEAGWFEEPNVRRGGWSGVSRYSLRLADGSTPGIFIKRQQNHQTWSWRHPLTGIPTFEREFARIMFYRQCQVPSLEPLYFATRRVGKDARAILVTRELAGYQSMEERVGQWLRDGAPARAVRRRYLTAIAGVLRQMHAQRIQHNCFFPKHVFVREDEHGAVAVRVIDLEKSRIRPSRSLCALRDLYSLVRHSQMWSRSDRLYFFLCYRGHARLTRHDKWLWRLIDRRAVKKQRIAAGAPRLRSAGGAHSALS